LITRVDPDWEGGPQGDLADLYLTNLCEVGLMAFEQDLLEGFPSDHISPIRLYLLFSRNGFGPVPTHSFICGHQRVDYPHLPIMGICTSSRSLSDVDYERYLTILLDI
jgi:hypothetical protein